MKVLILLLSMLFMNISFADEVKIELNPTKPVAGEVFQAIFRVFTDAEEEPVINFSPYRVEVVGKNNYGVKTSTTWINGKFSSTREMTIIYDLAAKDPGLAGLRDISVQVGDKNLRHPSLAFNVLSEPEVAADTFVMADVPKKSIYLGEGIVVRYYLYSKVPVTNMDIKKYPKLNNFLKRFLQEPDRSERVSVDGQLYMRNLIYGAKVFPEKIGELKIDPLQLTATVIKDSGDPFANFGMNRQSRMKTLSSEIIKVEVKPLPEDGKTPNFTGLVGKHDFNLRINSSRLIVNEPLEVKLTVSGGGALENMDAPTVLDHPELEEFESNGDLKIMDADQAIKVFDYTFLPKAEMSMPGSTFTLSYFDPELGKYVPVEMNIPEIVVAGGVQRPKKEFNKEDDKDEKSTSISKVPSTLSGPVVEGAKSWRSWIGYVNLSLSIMAVALAFGLIIKKEQLPSFSKNSIPSEFKKGRFDLGEFVRWMTPLIAKTGKSPMAVIKDSDLSQDAKSYFIDLIDSNDYKDYSHVKGQLKYVYRPEAFKELDKYIQSVKNENTPQTA